MLSAADAACYAAKDQGRNRVHVYQEDDASSRSGTARCEWVARAKRALTENRLFLEAQPIVPLQDAGRSRCTHALRVARAHA